MMQTIQKTICAALLLFILAACSGTEGSTQAPTAPLAPAALTMKEQIKALEDSGKLPKLDRSTSIAGPDVNNNGIRDDIDAWIAALPISDVQKKAVQQDARVQQATLLVDLTSKSELKRIGDLIARSVQCMYFSFQPDYQQGFDLASQVEAITANTKERAMQYLAYNRARSGSVTSSVKGNTCDP
jgi:hypothetical protein